MSYLFQIILWAWTLNYKIFAFLSLASCVASSSDASDSHYGKDPRTSIYQLRVFSIIFYFYFYFCLLWDLGTLEKKQPIPSRIQYSEVWCCRIIYCSSRKFLMDENSKGSIHQSHMDTCILPYIIPFQTKQGLTKDVLEPQNVIFKT